MAERATYATYVYCVSDAAEARRVPAPPPGLPRAEKPRLLELDSALAAVVADVPLGEYSGDRIEKGLEDLDWVSRCAVGHEAVVEHFAHYASVVPMKMFTLFTSDERVKEDLRAKKKEIVKVLGRLRGREEYGVRVAFDEARAIASASASASAGAGAGGSADGDGAGAAAKAPSGTAFLMRKKGERDVRERFRVNAAKDATALYDELAVGSADARRRPLPAGVQNARVVLDAAFLVGRDVAEEFRAEVQAHAERMKALGYDVVLTGPWPAYNFVQEGS